MNAIDFSKLPVDTLVDVMSLQFGILTLHFKRQTDDGRYFCTNYTAATSSVSVCSEWANSYSRIRISDKNPWLPWFGGECPVPPNCVVDVILRDGSFRYPKPIAGEIRWSHEDDDNAIELDDCTDVIAYRLIESPWQTIEVES